MKNQRISAMLVITATLLSLSSPEAIALTPREIYQKVSPAVVFILAAEGWTVGRGGTGSIIRDDGLVITSAHLFARKNSSKPRAGVSVFLKPERVTGSYQLDLSRRYQGKIVAYDVPLDLALVRITNVDVPLPTVDFGDSDKVTTGDQAYAIGHPEQGGLWSLTTGVISAQRKDFNGVIGKDLFQTEASINRGNSGGPLLDQHGVMIGINSMIARQAADGMPITDVNFSIKSKVALTWLNRLGYRFSAAGHLPAKADEEVVGGPSQSWDVSVQPRKEAKCDEAKPTRGSGTVGEGFMEPKGQKDAESGPVEDREKLFQEGEILTKKTPYNMDDLIASMEEMEDLMEEMRGKIEKSRQRRYP
jgi:serine protease Do